jgi:histidine kinase
MKSLEIHKVLYSGLVSKLLITVGSTLGVILSAWTYLIVNYQISSAIVPALLLFIAGFAVIFVFARKFIRHPITTLIEKTRRIAEGDYTGPVKISQKDEIGRLGAAFNQMGEAIGALQTELNRQRDEYQMLFEHVPCLITVQDKNFKLVGFNREFSEKFNPQPGDYCFHAYKGRDEKCRSCPVEQTFEDGASHYSEEIGADKDGNVTHWIVKTSPIRGKAGDIVAAMEMSLDITQMRHLEKQLEKTEEKYQEIFQTIPNPVFVVDAESLDIIDCNKSVKDVYGYDKATLIHRPFMDLFREDERAKYASSIRSASVINQIRHITKEGKRIFVDIWISPSEYSGKKVLLVTASDITQRLETEQQLIQASKMATLGEMATGVAHELNQPLSVIKTSSSFFMKKLNKKENLEEKVLFTLLEKIDSNVDRATKIINHMRQFARKSEMELENVYVNEILEGAFEVFSQQLKVRGIAVERNTAADLPRIKADPGRLEQVFINLLINARDAIEARWGSQTSHPSEKKIALRTERVENSVVVEVCDTGIGIPADIQDKIFEPFYTTKEVGKGTGLGLSISYGIVKECGGNIEVESKAGEGTCFRLKFPSAENENG